MQIFHTRWLGVGAALCAATAALAEPALVPVKDFARRPSFEQARISPTGQYLAVSIPYGDQTALGILDIRNLKITGTLRFSHGEHVYDFHWVGPERVIVEIASRGGPLDQPRLTGELYGMNADGSNKKYLFGYRGSEQVGTHIGASTKEYSWAWILDPLPRDPLRALITVVPMQYRADFANPIIETLEVMSGARRRVSVLEGYDPAAVTDDAGRLRFATSEDAKERRQMFAAAAGPTGWQRVELAGATPEVVKLYSSSADGESVYLTIEDDKGRSCLHEYRFGRGLGELVCREHGGVGTPVLSFDDHKPIGLLRGHGAPETQYFDDKHPDARFRTALQKAFGAQHISVTSRTLDNKSVVVAVDSDRNPGDFYLVDRQTKKAEYLISRRSWIDPAAMTPVKPISYQTRDGATIHGYLTVRGKDVRKAPLVLMPHGGPHGIRDTWEFDAWAQLLASRGYAVLQPNYRGSGGYGMAHEKAGHRKWGTLMQDDLTDAVRWAIDEGIADKDRVCILGGSYGGYAALMSPLREPDLYRCAIGLAGAYDLVEQADDSDTADYVMGRKYLDRVLGDDKLKAEHSPVTHIGKLKVPVLIAHGTADKRVPFSQAKLLRKALEKHKKPYEWMEFQGEEHGFYDDKNHEAFLNKLLEFLDKHIGAGTTAPKQAAATAPAS